MERRRPLLSGAFLRYWRAEAVSGLGTYVTLFALQTLVVVTLHGSAADVGWVNAARWLPYLVLGLVVGAVVDRRRRLPVMIATDLVQAVLLVAVPVLWWSDRLTLPALVVVVIGYGAASVVNDAAAMSLLPRLVDRSALQPAHARIDGADAVSGVAGPALCGVLVSVVGAPLAVLVDSLTYLYSALTLSRLDVAEPTAYDVGAVGGRSPGRALGRARGRVRGLARDVVDGLRWIYRGSGLTTISLATHGWFAGHAIVGVVLAPYVLRTLDLPTWQFGLVGAAGGVGAVLGTALTTAVGRRHGTGRTIIAGHALTTLAVVVLVLAGQGTGRVVTLAVLGLGQGLYGLAMGLTNSHEMSYRQLVTPDDLQARTHITLRSLNRAVIVVVAPLAGALADAWGIRPTLVLAAAIFALVVAGLGASPFRSAQATV